MRRKGHGRSKQGAALVEGVASLWLIVSITVASISLLINSGMSMFYKQKIAYVAMQTATYTAQMKMNEDKTSRGEELAKSLLSKMGFNVAQTEVDIKEISVEGAPSIQVDITCKNLPLFHGTEAGMMPFSVTLGDSATCIKQQAPEAYVWLNNNPKMSGYLIPVVRMPPGGVGASGLPYVIP